MVIYAIALGRKLRISAPQTDRSAIATSRKTRNLLVLNKENAD